MSAQDLTGYRRNHRRLPDVQPCGERRAPHDPAYHGGARRYDLKVIDRGAKGRLLVDDAKLSPLPLGTVLA